MRVPLASHQSTSRPWAARYTSSSKLPSSRVATVSRSGIATMVTSSAMARPWYPVRAVSEPSNSCGVAPTIAEPFGATR